MDRDGVIDQLLTTGLIHEMEYFMSTHEMEYLVSTGSKQRPSRRLLRA